MNIPTKKPPMIESLETAALADVSGGSKRRCNNGNNYNYRPASPWPTRGSAGTQSAPWNSWFSRGGFNPFAGFSWNGRSRCGNR